MITLLSLDLEGLEQVHHLIIRVTGFTVISPLFSDSHFINPLKV